VEIFVEIIIWALGWYLFIIGGIILIIVGFSAFSYGWGILIFLGILIFIDGILGVYTPRKLGKKKGNKVTILFTFLTLGAFLIINDLNYPILSYLFIPSPYPLIIGLIMVGVGIYGLLYITEKNNPKAEDTSINNPPQNQKLTKIALNNEEKLIMTICEFLEENQGSAFTSNSLFNRCEEIKNFSPNLKDIEKILKIAYLRGKIGKQEKENQIYYFSY
jgi:hypothetical protein